jgi:uncharacterized protein (TIGR00375 family)
MTTYSTIFADLHIHIGRTKRNQPVKVTASPNMTFKKIIQESFYHKGLQMIGIIDSHSPGVQEEIQEGLHLGLYKEHPDGGIVYQETTCILGAEIEIKEPNQGAFHVLVYFPWLEQMECFTKWLAKYMTNVQLSTQRLYQPVAVLQEIVSEIGGVFIPAHVFTPFKGVYGSVSNRMSHVLNLSGITGVELGLSSDRILADRISELQTFTFLTNSDAHSLMKIGREYNELLLKEPSFKEFKLALTRQEGRKVIANYGLNPCLGKYYRTRCQDCKELWPVEKEVKLCSYCGSEKNIKGVYNRINEIADQETTHPTHRPPYVYQIPLEFIPKLGKKTLQKLLNAFGTEMNILHRVPWKEIVNIAGEEIANLIQLARKQRIQLQEGGGGRYGKVTSC